MSSFKRVSEDGAPQAVFQDHAGAILTLQGDHPFAGHDEFDMGWPERKESEEAAPPAPPESTGPYDAPEFSHVPEGESEG